MRRLSIIPQILHRFCPPNKKRQDKKCRETNVGTRRKETKLPGQLPPHHTPPPTQKPRDPAPTAEPALAGPSPQTAVRIAVVAARVREEVLPRRRLPPVVQGSNPGPTSRTFALSWWCCMMVPTNYRHRDESIISCGLCRQSRRQPLWNCSVEHQSSFLPTISISPIEEL